MAGIPTGGTCVIASKHPPGIFMRVFKREEFDTPVLGGGTRRESRGVTVGDTIKINGPAVPYGKAPPFVIAGGYALTPNVPLDFATSWMEQNKDSALVKNNLLFIHEKQEFAEKRAREQKDLKSGLEPLDVGTIFKNGVPAPKDPRWPARVNPNLSGIATDKRNDM